MVHQGQRPMNKQPALKIELEEQCPFQPGNNGTTLAVHNTSDVVYQEIVIRLMGSTGLILRPNRIPIVPLPARSSKRIPLSLFAPQPGQHHIAIRTSTFPPPPDGFLNTILVLEVAPLPVSKPTAHLLEALKSPQMTHISPTNGAGQGYDLAKMRRLLNDIFTERELRDYCLDEPGFRQVFNDLRETDRKSEIVQQLIAYAWRKSLMAQLLFWAKAINPDRYSEGEPYEL